MNHTNSRRVGRVKRGPPVPCRLVRSCKVRWASFHSTHPTSTSTCNPRKNSKSAVDDAHENKRDASENDRNRPKGTEHKNFLGRHFMAITEVCCLPKVFVYCDGECSRENIDQSDNNPDEARNDGDQSKQHEKNRTVFSGRRKGDTRQHGKQNDADEHASSDRRYNEKTFLSLVLRWLHRSPFYFSQNLLSIHMISVDWPPPQVFLCDLIPRLFTHKRRKHT